MEKFPKRDKNHDCDGTKMSVKLRKTPKVTEQAKISVITETRQSLNQCKNSHHQMETLFGHFSEVPNLCQGKDSEKYIFEVFKNISTSKTISKAT